MLYLVHASDMHFGETVQGSWGGRERFQDTGTAQTFPTFKGHDLLAASDFADWWMDFTRSALAPNARPSGQSPQSCFCHTGDLTAKGGASEFAVARDFLTNTTTVALPDQGRVMRWGLGLGIGNVARGPLQHALLHIPGNHDYWGGKARSLVLKSTTSPATVAAEFLCPRVEPIADPDDTTFEVHAVLLDSFDSYVHAPSRSYMGQTAFIAKAQIATATGQLLAAAGAARRRGVRTVLRVALVHHSPDNVDDPAPHADLASKSQVLDWCRDQVVPVLLTGHQHEPELRREWASSPVHVIERRCGTTLQQALLPSATMPGPYWNAFLHHSVEPPTVGRRSARWTTALFARELDHPFVRVDATQTDVDIILL